MARRAARARREPRPAGPRGRRTAPTKAPFTEATARDRVHPHLREPRGPARALDPLGPRPGSPEHRGRRRRRCRAAGDRRGIERLGDPRVRYENLAVRGLYPDDPRQRWLVAGTGPLNRAFELARGSWIAVNNDDDALLPNDVSTLLAEAQQSRDEVVYGRLIQHAPDGSTETIGEFPPVNHGFGWQLALQHRALLLFEFKLSAALFGEPGDWDRARRMLRAGVRFAHDRQDRLRVLPELAVARPGDPLPGAPAAAGRRHRRVLRPRRRDPLVLQPRSVPRAARGAPRGVSRRCAACPSPTRRSA